MSKATSSHDDRDATTVGVVAIDRFIAAAKTRQRKREASIRTLA